LTCGFGLANDLLAIVLPGFHNGKPFAGFLSVTMQLHHRESRALPAQNQQTGNFMYFLDFRFAGSEYRFHPEAGIRPVRRNEILYFPTAFLNCLFRRSCENRRYFLLPFLHKVLGSSAIGSGCVRICPMLHQECNN